MCRRLLLKQSVMLYVRITKTRAFNLGISKGIRQDLSCRFTSKVYDVSSRIILAG